jgi:hypothetical protein
MMSLMPLAVFARMRLMLPSRFRSWKTPEF